MPFTVQPKRVFTISPVEPIKPIQKNHAQNQLMVQARTRATPTQRNESRLSQIRQLATVENVRSWFTQNMRNYCETTSLHGLNYIVRSDISRRERLFWVGVIMISIITSIVLVIVSWHWNSETPTVTVIESSHFPTWNIPFPAITICNFNKISKKNALLLAKKMKRPSNVSETDLLNLFHITMYFSFAIDYTEMDYGLFEEILNENNFTVRELTEKLTPDCMETISKCIWKGTNSRCDALFQRINTTEGVCCAFNYFGQTSSNFPEKIAYQVPKRPYRVTGCGYPTGLSVLLDPNAEDYFGTYFSSYGFRLLIHDAYNFPDENAETKVVTSMRESFVRINPESTYATSDVENMNPITRNCLFSSEHRLSVMQRYSFINCMSECRIQMLYKRCGCIPINLPNNGSYPICGLRRVFCITQSREIFIRALPTIEESLSVVKTNEVFPCNCMPDCEANRYPSEITMGRLSEGNNDLKTNRTNNNDKNNVLLHIFFSDLMSTRYRMEIFQNWLSSLASFGGLLGLIMGFSIVTAFEFFYFLTFRPIFNYFNDA